MKTVAVKLPEDLIARADRTSRKHNVNRSELFREALRRHLASLEGPEEGSFAERAERYIGSVEGPRDLSHDKRHMKGFGK